MQLIGQLRYKQGMSISVQDGTVDGKLNDLKVSEGSADLKQQVEEGA